MDTLKGKSAVVVGASSGVGQAVLRQLASQGMKVTGVARGRERLERIAREAPGEVLAVVADATDGQVAARLVREGDPDLLVLCAGVHAELAPLDQHSWESFSAPWNGDVKMTFHFFQEALKRPLRSGSTVVVLSSGAAIGGSPLSGGYAGSKRTQWFMADYAQKVSRARSLGIRFVALVPKQLIVGTETGDVASRAYAAQAGITQEKFMERFGTPLTPEGVADAVVRAALGEVAPEGGAVAVMGKGLEALPT